MAYATKPFKLTKRLFDVHILFERHSNNLNQQLKKMNMSKNKIIEDIKADRILIRNALPMMATNYLSSINESPTKQSVHTDTSNSRQGKSSSDTTINSLSRKVRSEAAALVPAAAAAAASETSAEHLMSRTKERKKNFGRTVNTGRLLHSLFLGDPEKHLSKHDSFLSNHRSSQQSTNVRTLDSSPSVKTMTVSPDAKERLLLSRKPTLDGFTTK